MPPTSSPASVKRARSIQQARRPQSGARDPLRLPSRRLICALLGLGAIRPPRACQLAVQVTLHSAACLASPSLRLLLSVETD